MRLLLELHKGMYRANMKDHVEHIRTLYDWEVITRWKEPTAKSPKWYLWKKAHVKLGIWVPRMTARMTPLQAKITRRISNRKDYLRRKALKGAAK